MHLKFANFLVGLVKKGRIRNRNDLKSRIRIRTSWGPFLHFSPCCALDIYFLFLLDLENSTRHSCRWTNEESVLVLLPDFSCESVQSLVCFFYTGETGPHTHAQLNVFKGMSVTVSMSTYFLSPVLYLLCL